MQSFIVIKEHLFKLIRIGFFENFFVSNSLNKIYLYLCICQMESRIFKKLSPVNQCVLIQLFMIIKQYTHEFLNIMATVNDTKEKKLQKRKTSVLTNLHNVRLLHHMTNFSDFLKLKFRALCSVPKSTGVFLQSVLYFISQHL